MASRREEILDATLRVIARDGIDGIRSATVAGEAGMSAPLLHYYFPTLDDLVLAAYWHDAERTWEQLPPPLGESGPIERLHAGMTEVLVERGPELRSTLMLWHEFVRRAVFDETVHEVVIRRLERWVDDGEVLTRLAQESGALPAAIDPRMFSIRLASLFAGITALELLDIAPAGWGERQIRAAIDGDADWRPVPPALRHPPRVLPELQPAPEPTRREEILDATLRVIADHGIKGVHFPEVAEEAGVSMSLPRYYFPTIDDLLMAAVEREEEVATRMARARLDQIDDPEERLFDALIHEVTLDPGVMHDNWVIWNEFLRLGCVDPEMRERAVASMRRWRDSVADPIRGLQAAGRVAAGIDADDAALRIIATAHGAGTGLLVGLIDAATFPVLIDWTVVDELALAD